MTLVYKYEKRKCMQLCDVLEKLFIFETGINYLIYIVYAKSDRYDICLYFCEKISVVICMAGFPSEYLKSRIISVFNNTIVFDTVKAMC